MKIVTLEEIKACLDLDKAIAAVRDGFVAHAGGVTRIGAVGHLPFPQVDGDCHIKSAAMADAPFFVVKVASGFPRNADMGLKASDGMMMLFDAQTGAPVTLLLDQGYLTDLRTAIAGGLAAALIRPVHCEAIGIIGTGIQARLQAELAARLTGIKRILIWGRSPVKAERVAADLEGKGFAASTIDDIGRLSQRTRLVITTTPSRSPLLTRANVGPGMRIVAVGADTAGKQEIETEVTAAADLIVADSKAQCLDHGELSSPFRRGLIDEHRIVELGAVLDNPPTIPQGSSVLIDLTGVGIQDLQIATSVWDGLSAFPERLSTARRRSPGA